jgi:hypothetical protein
MGKNVPERGRNEISIFQRRIITQEATMKFLCLAYGNEEEWNALSKGDQDKLLAQDELLRSQGGFVAPVQEATTVRAPRGQVITQDGPFAESTLPLAGFSLIDARDLNEAIALVSKTPCASAGGIVEIWPVLNT